MSSFAFLICTISFVKKILSKIPYKYLIVTISFVLFMLFIDQNDWITQYNRKNQLRETKAHIEFLTKEIERMSSEIDKIKADHDYVIQLSRDKYLYKKDNEDVFVIVKDTVYTSKENTN